MCFATISLATASLYAGIAGAATSAGGALYSGAAAKNAAVYQSAVAHNNEQIANQNAEYAAKAGQAQAAAQSLKGAAAQGKLKTAQAASGVDVNTGSAVDVRVSQREIEKLDTNTVLNNSLLTRYGYRAQASNFAAEAALDEAKGDSAMLGATIGATGSLLSNASALGSKWWGFGPATDGFTAEVPGDGQPLRINSYAPPPPPPKGPSGLY
jgi:hypothetical protein